MTRRHFLGSAAALAQGQARPPNIVFLYTDDQARWSVGAYGNKDSRTPNMDRLASEGALFERAFVSTPVCSPARAALLTSQPSFRTGIRDFIDVRREPGLGLPVSFPTWPQLLQDRGYRTGLFGKWHLGTRPEHHPTRRGYHEFYGFLEGGNTPMDPFLEVDGQSRRVNGSLPDLLADSCIDFLRRHKNGPLLASVHFRAPHGPYGPVPEADSTALNSVAPSTPDVKGLDRKWASSSLLAYYRSVASVDRNIGRILAALEQFDLHRNTIVIFTSDHGYMIGHHGANGKGNATAAPGAGSGRRPNLYDDSMRTPLLIRWPGVVRPGRRIGQLVSHLDFFPTLAGIAGAPVPHNYLPCGYDFTPLLRGQDVPWRDTLYGDYDMYHYYEDSMRMIRTSRWKLVTHSSREVQHEFFDLQEDPGETRNLIGSPEHAANMRALRRRLYDWQVWMGDPRRRSPDEEM